MDFELSPAQREFRDELRQWLLDNLPAGWTSGERDIPLEFDERERFLREWQRKLHDGGWTGLAWPKKYGGQDATLIEQVIYDQELTRVNAPPELNSTGLNMVGPTLIQMGTETQKERFLHPILTCEEVWCQGYSEPNAGSDLASLTTSAEVSDEELVITGQKIWTSGAHFADWMFLLVRTDPNEQRHRGITAVMMDMDQDGVSVEPIHEIDGEHHFNHVFLDDAIADVENVIGEINEGWGVAMKLSRFERTTSLVFELERRWNEIAEYCRTHSRNGTLLCEDPLVRNRLADLDTRIQASKLTYLRNIGKRIDREGQPSPDGLMDNVYSRELKQELEAFAIALKGPDTARWESGSVADKHPMYRLRYTGGTEGWWTGEYLASFGLTIGGGTSDIKRSLIAERVLDLPKGLRAE